MNHFPFAYKTLDGLNAIGGGGGGTVTSVSASVPSWLSVSVTNPTTTPNIVISGSATGSGITVLQDAPTLINVVTMTGHLDITRNSGSGEAITISNSHSGLQDNYIAVSKNSSAGNHAHFGHHYVNSNDAGNYAYIQTKGNQFIFTGDAKFQLPTTLGSNGQALITNGAGITSWTSLTTGTVMSVSASVPAFLSVNVSNSTTTPAIAITLSGSALPTTSGGTGLTSIGTNGQVLTSNGTSLTWTTPTTGTVTSVSGSSPINSSGGNTPTISLSTVPTTLGGTGLTTVGSNGQVLTSNGTSLSWTTPTTGTVTSVSATSPLASSGGATPTISISSSTGTGAVVLENDPTITTGLTVAGTTSSAAYIRSGTLGVGSLTNISDLYLTQVGGGGGYVNQYLRAAYDATNGYYISVNTGAGATIGDLVVNTRRIYCDNDCYIQIVNEPYSIVNNSQYTILRTFGGIGLYGYKNTSNNSLDLRFAYVSTYGTPIIGMTLRYDGNVGIGTTTPTRKLTVSDDNTSVIRFERTGAGRYDAEIGLFNNGDFQIQGGADGTTLTEFLRILGLNGNVGINTATPIAKLHVNAPGGQQFYIESADSFSYMAFAPNNTRKCYFGFPYGGAASKDLVMVNEYSDGGDIFFDASYASAKIRCVKPILLQETVTLNRHPTSSAFTFVFPASMGTSGQVLTTDGTNTYWGSGGGGGGGTVNSVTASAPLASSGGTAPNISIASATGTGAVVLQTTPLLLGNVNVGYAGGSSKLNIGDGALDTARYGSVQISQDSTTIINTGNNVAALSFVRSGNYVHGMGYKQSSSTFGFGPAVTSGFNPNFLAITTSGDIGIGTSSPSTKLYIDGGNATMYNGTNVGFQYRNDNRFYTIGIRGDTSNVFAITDDTASAFRMVINSIGNVGIGTTSPNYKLDVNGAFACKSDAIIAASTAGQGHLQFSSTGNANYIRFGLDGTSGSYAPLIFTSSAGYIEWMRITADGKIGINKFNPAQALDVGGVIQTAYGNGGVVQFWDSNFAIYGRRSYSDSILGPYGDKLSFYSYGGHEWFGGNQPIATQVQLMTLTAGGSLGIGTSTPAYRLDVSTTSNATTKFAVHNGYNAGFSYSWNDSGSVGESNFYNYKGSGFGGFSFQNKNTSNSITDYANIDCGSVYARNYFTTNGVDNFTYSEVNFTPIMLVYNGSSGSYGPIVYNAAGYMNFLTYTIQTGRISRIGRVVTVSVDISYNYQWVPFGPTSGANQIAILLPGACRTTALSASGAAGYPNNLAGISNPIAMWLGNCSYDAGSGQTANAYIAPTSGTSFIAWNTSSTFINQRLFWSVSYNVT